MRSDLETDTAKTDPQSVSAATYRPHRHPQDGLIDWHREATAQYNWIRGLTDPYPGAYSFYQATKLTVWEANPLDRLPVVAAPGEFLDIVPGSGIDVTTGSGTIRLRRPTPDDRPSKWADRHAAGAELAPGSILGRHHAPGELLYTGIIGPAASTMFDTNLRVGERGELTIILFAGSATDHTVSVM